MKSQCQTGTELAPMRVFTYKHPPNRIIYRQPFIHRSITCPYFPLHRDLQEEYERLKSIRDQTGPPSDNDASPGGAQNRDSELLAEAKLLRQHKGRLEARMQVLEDHNRQLEAQLQRLRQLLDQVQFFCLFFVFWFCFCLFVFFPFANMVILFSNLLNSIKMKSSDHSSKVKVTSPMYH